ncbi:MAG: hypothetical protein E7337_14310 [Clostridiales bacterium]|nr:hypothetical protein [Clostridiales bacterium]
MYNFLTKHTRIRVGVILVSFLAGMALTFIGWFMTGKLKGLGLMILGLALLIFALYVYNKPFQDPK